jgi:hypothetical protein
MLQVAASLSDVANVVVERKARRPLQVTGVDDAKPPRVRKQKLSAPDR